MNELQKSYIILIALLLGTGAIAVLWRDYIISIPAIMLGIFLSLACLGNIEYIKAYKQTKPKA